MKKFQWVPNTLVYSEEHDLCGKINGENTILTGNNETLPVDITECRYATEEEAEDLLADAPAATELEEKA